MSEQTENDFTRISFAQLRFYLVIIKQTNR